MLLRAQCAPNEVWFYYYVYIHISFSYESSIVIFHLPSRILWAKRHDFVHSIELSWSRLRYMQYNLVDSLRTAQSSHWKCENEKANSTWFRFSEWHARTTNIRSQCKIVNWYAAVLGDTLDICFGSDGISAHGAPRAPSTVTIDVNKKRCCCDACHEPHIAHFMFIFHL